MKGHCKAYADIFASRREFRVVGNLLFLVQYGKQISLGFPFAALFEP